MRNKNICKFVTPSIDDRLSVSSFILESNEEVMKGNRTLINNRMLLFVSGEGRLRFDRTDMSFSVGDVIFGFKGESFAVSPGKGTEYMYIEFSGNRAEELFRRFDITAHQRRFHGYDGLIPLWKESLSRALEQTVDLAAESILLYTFSRLLSENAESSGVIGKMIEISEAEFTDPALSLNSLSEELGYNSKYLSHTFKEKMGMGYSEYLRNLRIKYAVSLFDHGIDSVKNVAALSGFSDPLYFSTVFKNTVGVSPKEYLKK